MTHNRNQNYWETAQIGKSVNLQSWVLPTTNSEDYININYEVKNLFRQDYSREARVKWKQGGAELCQAQCEVKQ